jgi:KaiC/GvpD/RAD55 family RecA-like ATPase
MPEACGFSGVLAAVLLGAWLEARRKMRKEAEAVKRWRRLWESTAYEAANAANAIRGHVLALRHLVADEGPRAHLKEIEQALERMGAALEPAQKPEAPRGQPRAPRVTAPCSGQDLTG